MEIGMLATAVTPMERQISTGFRLLSVFLASVSLLLTHANAVELVGIDHFATHVRDVQKSADWYNTVFGFAILHKWDNAWMVGRGNIKIGLFI
jgi:catechol-2,3-dioxygenase